MLSHDFHVHHDDDTHHRDVRNPAKGIRCPFRLHAHPSDISPTTTRPLTFSPSLVFSSLIDSLIIIFSLSLFSSSSCHLICLVRLILSSFFSPSCNSKLSINLGGSPPPPNSQRSNPLSPPGKMNQGSIVFLSLSFSD